MKTSDIIKSISENYGIPKVTVKAVIDAYHDAVIDALKRGDEYNLPGIGKFTQKVRAEREGRNPQTGEKIVISEHKVISFKVSSSLKKAVEQE